ncbi:MULTISPECIES: sugar phosphate isomerase/epimerase [Enterocloster]|uniref:Sugar phosphate isomerase/epimerase n=1 Tax=Enterocloster lavalensis TaxID=460384 RepID=A0A1I0GPD3_9FIRM|nr:MULTISPECIES: sugar phosphate isomerase/epimerase [Enterocloster]MDR3759045.1 sugar phosphate isomerase/epimerase [Enterocloster sp.]SET72829.1 Sugar phosphate isomerase/epimerase [Enterocloster lavalensis]
MRLSTSTSILYQNKRFGRFYQVEDSIRLCAESGFRHVDVNFYDQGLEGNPLARDGWEQWVDGLRQQAEACGITIFQTHAFCYRTAESTDFTIDRPWFEERIRRSITASRMLGAEWTVIHPADFSRDPEYSAEKCKAFNCEYWKPFVELGVKCGVGIAFENMFQSGFKQRYCSEVDEIISLADSFHEELVGICWDTGHGALSGQDQGEAIRKIGKRLKAMHVNDNHALPKQDEHLMPFYGTIDWLAIMEALKDIGYSHDFAYELKQATQTLPPELCGEMLRFLYDLGMNLMERAAMCEN